jgi:hypothetical protein
MTNFEKIKAMTKEELAIFILECADDCYGSFDGMVRWLESEAKEEDAY